METVATQAPAWSQIGEATQETRKSVSLIWIERRSAKACRESFARAFGLVSARAVGEALAPALKIARRSASGRWPTRSRPDAVQFRGTRVPTSDITRKWPGPSAMARTTV